jgi:hypothetical protein
LPRVCGSEDFQGCPGATMELLSRAILAANVIGSMQIEACWEPDTEYTKQRSASLIPVVAVV